jgi:hypothetical protein
MNFRQIHLATFAIQPMQISKRLRNNQKIYPENMMRKRWNVDAGDGSAQSAPSSNDMPIIGFLRKLSHFL